MTKRYSNPPDRRKFLGQVGGLSAATWAASAIGLPALALLSSEEAQAAAVGPQNANQRASKAYQVRHKAALDQSKLPNAAHPTNGDEEAYSNFIGSYTKALPHNAQGEAVPSAYAALVQAMRTGARADFDAIPQGGTVKQVNPQAALCFELDGADSHHLSMPAPPAFASEDEAAEMCEVYWMALARDVPFSQYGSHPLIAAAVSDLQQFAKFSGVNSANVFRGDTPGDVAGPYVSQFLLKNFSFGAMTSVEQKYRTTVPGNDFMTSFGEWLNIQNGVAPALSQTLDPTPRFIRDGRGLAEWDHRDFTYQGFLVAALILLGFGPNALDDNNPYKSSANQAGFACFGGPHILDLVARAANLGLKAAWYQKWSVHRRLRPEAFGGRVHAHKTGLASYPINTKLLNSQALTEVFNGTGSYLLPMAYAEGSPTHPAYPAGHGTIAGACATVLKAFFKETFNVPSPVQATDDGLALVPYAEALTVGGELNKLAHNVARGRDIAGVHWRSDGLEGVRLGEQVAIALLRDYRSTFNEGFAGFSLTKFDGATITI